jgi:hypothetical protein
MSGSSASPRHKHRGLPNSSELAIGVASPPSRSTSSDGRSSPMQRFARPQSPKPLAVSSHHVRSTSSSTPPASPSASRTRISVESTSGNRALGMDRLRSSSADKSHIDLTPAPAPPQQGFLPPILPYDVDLSPAPPPPSSSNNFLPPIRPYDADFSPAPPPGQSSYLAPIRPYNVDLSPAPPPAGVSSAPAFLPPITPYNADFTRAPSPPAFKVIDFFSHNPASQPVPDPALFAPAPDPDLVDL